MKSSDLWRGVCGAFRDWCHEGSLKHFTCRPTSLINIKSTYRAQPFSQGERISKHFTQTTTTTAYTPKMLLQQQMKGPGSDVSVYYNETLGCVASRRPCLTVSYTLLLCAESSQGHLYIACTWGPAWRGRPQPLLILGCGIVTVLPWSVALCCLSIQLCPATGRLSRCQQLPLFICGASHEGADRLIPAPYMNWRS